MSDTSKLLLPNTCQVPNVYLDELMPLLSESELKIVLYAVRRTLGFHKRYDPISLTQFMRGQRSKDGAILDNGTGLNRATLVTTLERLVEHGVLIKKGHGKNGDVWEPQLDYAKIDMTWFAARAQEGKRKIKARTVYPLNQARQQKQFNEQTSSSLASKPKVVYPLNTQNPGNPVETKIGASAPPASKKPEQPMTPTPKRDPVIDAFERHLQAQQKPNETIVRSWNLPNHLEQLCLWFVEDMGLMVVKGDKGRFAKGASQLYEFHISREQHREICKRARAQKTKDGRPLTYGGPGSLQALARQVVSEAAQAQARLKPVEIGGVTIMAEEC